LTNKAGGQKEQGLLIIKFREWCPFFKFTELNYYLKLIEDYGCIGTFNVVFYRVLFESLWWLQAVPGLGMQR
jgi:hypothetical protein